MLGTFEPSERVRVVLLRMALQRYTEQPPTPAGDWALLLGLCREQQADVLKIRLHAYKVKAVIQSLPRLRLPTGGSLQRQLLFPEAGPADSCSRGPLSALYALV